MLDFGLVRLVRRVVGHDHSPVRIPNHTAGRAALLVPHFALQFVNGFAKLGHLLVFFCDGLAIIPGGPDMKVGTGE